MTVSLERLTKMVGGETHIHEIDLSLPKGSLTVLLGATLAGKTSLLRLMAGLDKPTSGRILVDGRDVSGVPVQKRSVAVVYQQFINYPALSVYENIASPLRVRGAPKAEIDDKVRRTARLLRLDPYLDRLPLQLSGGQQQRTALARALVKGADLVLLDEPLANLDYKLREELREELPRLFEASGSIFVYATTEPHEALLLGGNLACLAEGRLLQYGPASQVYRRPDTIESALVSSDPPLNAFDAELHGGLVRFEGGGSDRARGLLASLPDGRYRIGVRAHQISLGAGDQAHYLFPAQVALTEITGSESFVHLETKAGNWIGVLPGVRNLKPGAAVEAAIDPWKCLVFAPDGTLVAAPAGG